MKFEKNFKERENIQIFPHLNDFGRGIYVTLKMIIPRQRFYFIHEQKNMIQREIIVKIINIYKLDT